MDDTEPRLIASNAEAKKYLTYKADMYDDMSVQLMILAENNVEIFKHSFNKDDWLEMLPALTRVIKGLK